MSYHINYAPDDLRWNTFVDQHPDAHVLQRAEWGTLKSAFGWSAARVAVAQDISGGQTPFVAGAQLLFRRLPLGLGTMAYLPAGPLHMNLDPRHPTSEYLWEGIHTTARRHRAAFLKLEPCNWYRPRPGLKSNLEHLGFVESPRTVQPPRTVVIDISGTEEEILKRMNQSTRYKVRLKEKKEIEIREGVLADVTSFNALMSVTGQRDGFGVHSPEYYAKAFELFSSSEHCALLIASYAGRDLAAMMVFRSGENAYYLYGASSNEERNRMPTYILQWEAIKWARRHGTIRYDLWGIPDVEEAQLEAEFETRRDGLWGVYGTKRGYGGQVVRSVGAWDKVYNPVIYAAYQWILRRRGME